MFSQVEMEAIQAIVTTGVTTLIGFLVTFIMHHISIAKLQKFQKIIETHQQLANTAVLFAEQAYKGFSGQAKKDIAIEFLAHKLNDLKIPVDQNQLEVLVESSLKTAKMKFGDAFKEATNTPAPTPTVIDNATCGVETTAPFPQTGQPTIKW